MDQMNPGKKVLSNQKLIELKSLFTRLPLEPATPHLDDEAIIGCVTETIPLDETEVLIQHIESCLACGARLDRLFQSGLAWQGQEGHKRILKLHRKYLETVTTPLTGQLSLLKKLEAELSKLVLTPPLFAPGYAQAATPIEVEGETESGLLQWYYRTDNLGNLTIRISSYNLDLEDVRVAAGSGDWEYVMTLKKVEENQVGAMAFLPEIALEHVHLEKGIHFQLVV
jgi:hypothetical protein